MHGYGGEGWEGFASGVMGLARQGASLRLAGGQMALCVDKVGRGGCLLEVTASELNVSVAEGCCGSRACTESGSSVTAGRKHKALTSLVRLKDGERGGGQAGPRGVRAVS